MTANDRPQIIRLADYQPPAWRVSQVDLQFDLDPARSLVHSTLQLQRNRAVQPQALRLDGEDLELLAIRLDGRELGPGEYRIDADGLHLPDVDADCQLQTTVAIAPERNTRLEGLYVSGPMLLTQCEAQGFRRITWFIDQPDVQASYTVELRAARARYPVLLSNGNPVDSGELPDGRHFARWHDPHPKPSYLFAIAAGDIDCVQAPFRTFEGRDVEVRIWAERRDVARCQYALQATLRAMRWDEQRFGRGYDLDQFNIVAAQDFTMGAMENKGLNIFNARYILADPETATDADFDAIESVIGHEYFHNWSGNRVTLRDWFQLSLKEGLTVFRDQEFSADLHSRGVKRIADVRTLRARQFIEDSGPLAHPVRPQAYTEINNFYTATVYEKGAEVIRMLHTLLGEADFRRGLDDYFASNDGRSATVEDLLAAMSAASGRDLVQFKRWYDVAGTPRLQVRDQFDAASGDYHLHIEQHTPDSPGQTAKPALHIPLAYALYAADGRRLGPPDEADCAHSGGLLELREAQHRLRWRGLADAPLPAFLQAQSAPVRLDYGYAPAQLARLVALESDPLLRWDAVQRLASDAILQRDAAAADALVDAVGSLLDSATHDPAFVAECLQLPDVATLADAQDPVDLDSIIREREDLLERLAETHVDRLLGEYRRLAAIEPDALSATAAAARRLKNVLLHWLTRLDPRDSLAQQQFAGAGTLTDRLAALHALVHFDSPTSASALAEFRQQWRDDLLLTDKWIGLVASRPQPEALDAIRVLLGDPSVWQPANPNRVRALLGTLARSNPVALHRRDGAGYRLLGEQVVAIDALNPQVAARLLTALEAWPKLDPIRQGLIRSLLDQLAGSAHSRDLADVLARLRAAG